MADGTITFSTALDNGQLEKDIRQAEREIDSLKRKIEQGKSEESFARQQMEAAKEATDEARQAVERLREELGVADEGRLAASLKAANREVAALEANMGKAEAGKSSIEEQMDRGEAAIHRTEQKVRDLKALLEELEGVDPSNADEWFGAQSEIAGTKQALEESNAALERQIEEQDALNDKWQDLDAKAGEYATKLGEATARQAELADKSSRLSEAGAALKEQTREQERLAKRWRSTNEQAEKYTRQLERATNRQRELGEEYARTYSRAGAAVSAGMERARGGVDAFASRINTMLKRVFVFGVILKAVRAIASALSGALAENDRFSASWENLKATVTGVASAIANLVAPALTGMVNAATAAIQALAQAIDGIFGTNIMQAIRAARSAAEANWRQTDASTAAQKALDKQRKATKDLAREQGEAAKALMSFDEINALQAETADDASDALGDEAEGLADPSALMRPDWGALDVGKIDAALAEIMVILGAALMAVGAILCFSGINIPLGITLMAIGALMVYAAYKEQWDKLPQEVRDAITGALVITGIVLVVLGAVLAFTGVNLPLGIGMMVAGALLLWTAVGLSWGTMGEEMQNVVTVLMGILSLALIVIGAILAFTGANVPLGVALMVAGAVSLAAVAAINWDRMPEGIRGVVSVVMGVLGGALLVVGAILALTGVSLPLGIGLMAVGAVILGADAALNWDAIQQNLDVVIPMIEAAVGGALLVVGAVLCFTGVNLPLGLGLMAVGAVSLGKAVAENWHRIPDEVKGVIAMVEYAVGGAALVVGAILCFTGVNLPLGLGLLAGGAVAMGHALTENWDYMDERVQGVIATVEYALGAAFLLVGAALCFTGANVPLGIGLLAFGALSMGHALTVNWDKMPKEVKRVIGMVELAVGGAALVVGAVLTFSGANLPLGIALMASGALAMGRALTLDWNELPEGVRGTVALIESIVAPALLVVGAILCFTGVSLPLGLMLLAGGALALAHLATLDWQRMPEGVRDTVSKVLDIVSGALIVIGVILCVTGVGIPLGIACIVAGVGAMVVEAALNWDFIVEKVREVWDSVVRFWDANIAPVFTWEWWANLFRSIVNGLIEQINNGLTAFGGFINSLADGVSGILDFFGVGGYSFQIGMPQIPYLAQGAVIPPNREFMAVLGDQTHGNNIETPEALMRQVVREEAGAMVAEVLRALAASGGGGRDVVLVVGRKELARETIRGAQELSASGELGDLAIGWA